ncbi:MAG: hypothetical protein AAFQ65_11070 [Myxococcota bacterium]
MRDSLFSLTLVVSVLSAATPALADIIAVPSPGGGQIGFKLAGQYIEYPKRWPLPWPPCRLELVDVLATLEVPLEELIEELDPAWEVALSETLEDPIEGIEDNPDIPNLVFSYVGERTLGPGRLYDLLTFAADAMPDPFGSKPVTYVGWGFDLETERLVRNVGELRLPAGR